MYLSQFLLSLKARSGVCLANMSVRLYASIQIIIERTMAMALTKDNIYIKTTRSGRVFFFHLWEK